MKKNQSNFVIFDCNSLIHRSFHALPPLSTSNGEVVNAVYGFFMMFLKAVADFKPEYVAACFDFPAKNFRHEKFAEYKAKRVRAPDELYSQIPKVKEALEAFGIKVFQKQGVEADDLIASIASNIKGFNKIIVSGDLDNTQLVDDETVIYTSGRQIKDTLVYDREKVFARFGVYPEMILDYKALVGDSSDNIPGGKGIGPKKALELLRAHGGIKKIFENIESGQAWDMSQKNKDLLMQNKDLIIMSYFLAETKKDCLPEFDLEQCAWSHFNREAAEATLKKYEFFSLINRLPF